MGKEIHGELNSGHFLEAADRLHVFQSIFDDHIAQHPVFMQRKELREKCEKIGEMLGEMYQIAGSEI